MKICFFKILIFKAAMFIKFILAFQICFSTLIYAAEKIEIKTFKGKELAPYINDIVTLCHTVYSEYPYLYDGNDAGYEEYISSYADSPSSMACLVFDGEKVIGAATGIPLIESRDLYQQAFKDNGEADLSGIYYLGELVLLKSYRGAGTGMKLHEGFENLVRSSSKYHKIALISIDLPAEDLRKPADYRPIAPFWQKLSYQQQPNIYFIAPWVNVGEKTESMHRMVFWTKSLD